MLNESLPVAGAEAQYAAVRHDETRLRPGVLALCRRLGQRSADVTRFPGGSLPVYVAALQDSAPAA